MSILTYTINQSKDVWYVTFTHCWSEPSPILWHHHYEGQRRTVHGAVGAWITIHRCVGKVIYPSLYCLTSRRLESLLAAFNFHFYLHKMTMLQTHNQCAFDFSQEWRSFVPVVYLAQNVADKWFMAITETLFIDHILLFFVNWPCVVLLVELFSEG